MKKSFRKMIAVMSTMMIAFGSFINKSTAYKADAADTVNVTASTTIDAEEIAEEMVAKFNEARAELGLEPLYIIPYLNEVAEVRATEIVELYSHTRPDGSKYISAIDTNTIDCLGAGEILLRGSASVNTIFAAWKNSTDHWEKITKPEATHIGLYAHFDPDSEKRWYWAGEIVSLPEGVEVEGQRLPMTDNNITTYTDEKGTPVAADNNDENTTPVEKVIYGDLNFDGIVDSFDLIFMTRYLNGKMEFNDAQLAAADMLTDGFVTDLDATILKMYILGKITQLPNI